MIFYKLETLNLKPFLHPSAMLLAFCAKMIGNPGSRSKYSPTPLHFAVKHPHRVELCPLPALFAQKRLMVPEKVPKYSYVGRPALAAPHGVKPQLQITKPQLTIDSGKKANHLCIKLGSRRTKSLYPQLVVLPVAP